MSEDFDFFIAQSETGHDEYESERGEFYRIVKDNNIFNLQLRYWTDALFHFSRLEGRFVLEDAVLIVNLLCNSLEALAGLNIDVTKIKTNTKGEQQTPDLKKMLEITLKIDRGWDLFFDKPNLRSVFEDMYKYHVNIAKHINISDKRKKYLKDMGYKKLCDFMKMTQEIWRWFLDKRNNGNIPKEQLYFFEREFK